MPLSLTTHVANFGDVVNLIVANPVQSITGVISIVAFVGSTLRSSRNQNLTMLQESMTTWEGLANSRAAEIADLDAKIAKLAEQLAAAQNRVNALELQLAARERTP